MVRRGDLVTILDCADRTYNAIFQGRQGVVSAIDISITGDGVELTFELVHPDTGKPLATAALVRLDQPVEQREHERGFTKLTKATRRRYE